MKYYNFFIAFLLITTNAFAQKDLKWASPLEYIQGRISNDSNFYRLPEKLKDDVRPPVWSLGNNAAGLFINFKTDAENITVRYKLKGALNMPHMPTTGVSGLDLYAYDEKQKHWNWTWGTYSFKDTVTYQFKDIGSHPEFTYELYLPLYNSVEWLEIGVENSKNITFIRRDELPIIVYGTSIAQGACASRPGLGWTNILNRKVKNPIVNLGFSGNGRLEKPILELIANTPSRVIVLDCIPNLGITPERSEATLDSLIISAVKYIREYQPNTPIILTDHSSGFNSNILNYKTNENYELSSIVGRKSFTKLKKMGYKNLYLLKNDTINLDINSTVDYGHPNDIGMQKIAEAYYKILRKI